MSDLTADHAPMDAELAALLQDLSREIDGETGPLPEPPPAHSGSRVAWEATTRVRRARHDAAALDLAAALERLSPLPDPSTRPIATAWDQAAVPGGTVGLRWYAPSEHAEAASLPLIALIHGGGYWMGGGAAAWQINDTLARELSARVGACVVSIDHRLAPEHPYPVPSADVRAALEHIVGAAGEHGADASRLVLYGISSGGNLAAVAAQEALLSGSPAPAAVVLEVPSVNLSLSSGRFSGTREETEAAERLIELYASGHDPAGPAISPGLRPDITGLSPTLILAARHDALTPDALAYADRLAGAGVDVRTHVAERMHTAATGAVRQETLELTARWLIDRVG